VLVPKETLELIYAAMLNGMDAVEEEDEERTGPAFDAIRALLSQSVVESAQQAHTTRTEAQQEPGNKDLANAVHKAMRRAFNFGQTYWRQAGSESYSQNKKADETEAKFIGLADEITSAVLAAPPQGFKPRELATLNGAKIKGLLDAVTGDLGPDPEVEITLIAHDTPFKSTDGDDMPAGLYFYWTEYPEEGIVMIEEDKQ
jgi:hypothetical protein